MTRIEWTDATWNPTVGCSIVSPGCTNCYAMKMAHRIAGTFPHYAGLTMRTKAGAVWTGKVAEARADVLLKPLRWKSPRRIFVNSMSDLFHEDLPDAAIDKVFAVMALCPQHTFQVLTKRAERMRKYFADADRFWKVTHHLDVTGLVWPLPNVWLGVSAERQIEAEERIPHLAMTPAAKRFISAEPLLGPVHLAGADLHCLDWVIAGGESGPRARPAHPDWIRGLRDQCARAGVPFFFKQWGEWVFNEACEPEPFERLGKKAAGAMLDGREHREWPA
ncbi:MAG TPA: phage Gp37/Gp68 family protein [Reyranella sp.]|nr:phage Gp37/Gp68 family protein [Reyranella sp.]